MTDRVWVSCSQELSWDVARYRHLMPRAQKGKAGGTTLCGATQATGDEFRGNTSKPACPKCEAAA